MARFVEIYDTQDDIKRLVNINHIVCVEGFKDKAVIRLSVGSEVITMYTDTSYKQMMFELTRIDRG